MYHPNNTPVYLRAYAGFIAGVTGAALVTDAGSYTLYAQMADAWAQAVDTAFGPGTPTGFHLVAIEHGSQAVWSTRAPLEASQAILPQAYVQAATGVVARALRGNTQIVAEGIDPNNTGGGGGGGGGGGSTTTTGVFARPAIGTTSTVGVADTTGAVPGATGATIGGVGPYLVTARSAASGVGAITLFNTGGDPTGSGTIASSSAVTFGAATLPFASAKQATGQALVAVNGAQTPTGVTPVTHLSSYAVDPTGATDSTAGVRAAIAAAGAAGLPLYCAAGSYNTHDLIVISASIELRSQYGVGPLFNARGGATGLYWGGSYIGDVFALLPASASVRSPIVYTHSGNFWWANLDGFNGTASGHHLLFWSETGLANLNALTAFTVEWNQNNHTYAAGTVFPCSGGSRSISTSSTRAFSVAHFNNTSPGFGITGTLTTVNGTFTCSSADQIFSFDTDYGLSATYDGSTFRLYQGPLAGTANLIASVSATGAVVQPWWENFLWGGDSGQGQWPYGSTDTTGPMRFGNMRLSRTARYTGSSYALPTTEFVAANADTNTSLMTSFAPAYTTSSAYPATGVVCASGDAAVLGLPVSVPANVMTFFRATLNTGTESGPAAKFTSIALQSWGGCLMGEDAIGVQTDSCSFIGGKGITLINNAYYSRHVNNTFIIGGSNVRNGYTWGVALVQNAGIAIVDNANFQSCGGVAGFVLSGSGATVIRDSKINTVTGYFGIYTSATPGDLILSNIGFGDEGGTGVQDSLFLLAGCQMVSWIGGGAFTLASASSSAPVTIDGGAQYIFRVDLATAPGSSSALVKFLSAPSTPVRLESTYQGQGLEPPAPWATGTGVSVTLDSNEISGRGDITFPSDADYTVPTINPTLFRNLRILGALTAPRNLIVPRNKGKRWRGNNTTTQTVTLIGPTGTGLGIPPNSFADAYDDGTNIVAA